MDLYARIYIFHVPPQPRCTRRERDREDRRERGVLDKVRYHVRRRVLRIEEEHGLDERAAKYLTVITCTLHDHERYNH